MGLSKKDLSRRRANFKAKLDELEQKTKFDPLKRNSALWDEIALLKKKMAED